MVAALSAVLFSSGCGVFSRSSEGDSGQANGIADREGVPEEQGLPLEDEVFRVDTTFWYAGFEVELGEAVLFTEILGLGEDQSPPPDLQPDQLRRVLTIDATFHNLRSADSEFAPGTNVVTDTATYPVFYDGETVPGGLSNTGQLIANVDLDFDPNAAYLLVGGGDFHQAQIPLRPGGGELINHEPLAVELSGTGTVGTLEVHLTGAEVRADVPGRHWQVEAGKLMLTLHFDAVSRRDGGGNLFARHFALILPDGTAIASDDYHNPHGLMEGNGDGVTFPDFTISFLIEAPPTGEYALRVRSGTSIGERWTPMGEDEEIDEIPFTLVG